MDTRRPKNCITRREFLRRATVSAAGAAALAPRVLSELHEAKEPALREARFVPDRTMYITLFFDVEDCVTPLSDDIAKDLADTLSDHGLKGEFMVVGDKARMLEKRGRWDVIEALRRHEVGLHTNRHSRHPNVAEYLEDNRWNDGIEEAVRREGPGVETIRRLFGRTPACWGQSGGSWGPQIHPAMKRLRVPVIVYPETYTPSSDIHWYGGVLTFGYRRFFEGFDQFFSEDKKFQRHFEAFQARVDENLDSGYPWMGLFCAHPITVRAFEFGDVLNFGHGKERPPELWKQPPLKSEAEYRTALKNFEILTKFIASHPRLQVVPISTVRERFGRVVNRINQSDLLSYAETAKGMKDIPIDDARLSPAEACDVLAQAILAFSKGMRPGEYVIRHIDGPVTMPPEKVSITSVAWDGFRSRCEFVNSFINRTGQLPASTGNVGIGSFYRAACDCFVALATQQTPKRVAFRSGPQIPTIAEVIARRTESGYRGWAIHKPDLKVTNLLELTRLQTWTLKPASF